MNAAGSGSRSRPGDRPSTTSGTKKMKRYLAAVLFTAVAMTATYASAQGQPTPANDMQALRAAVKADKRALVEKTLDLTPAEAKKFWPIYDTYQRSVDTSNRNTARAVEELVGYDKPLSDVFAKTLANQMIAADESEIKARRTMQNKLMRALPPKKAARYLQLEGKIRAFQDYDLAVAIPLVK
jgi:Spy/CpxP family protein refolding chaperone